MAYMLNISKSCLLAAPLTIMTSFITKNVITKNSSGFKELRKFSFKLVANPQSPSFECTYNQNSFDYNFCNYRKGQQVYPHVLVHLLKSFRAYIVKSSSTLFSDNIQWNLEISFSYARFNSLLGYNFLTESWDHQEWDFSDSCILKLKNPLSNVIYCFEKH